MQADRRRVDRDLLFNASYVPHAFFAPGKQVFPAEQVLRYRRRQKRQADRFYQLSREPASFFGVALHPGFGGVQDFDLRGDVEARASAQPSERFEAQMQVPFGFDGEAKAPFEVVKSLRSGFDVVENVASFEHEARVAQFQFRSATVGEAQSSDDVFSFCRVCIGQSWLKFITKL